MNEFKMVPRLGRCKYCDQTMTIEVPESFTDSQIDDEATKKCDCPEAHAIAERESAINLAEGQIKEFFKDKAYLSEVKDMLLNSVRPVAEHKLQSITIKKEEYKISIKNGTKGVKAIITQTISETIAGAE